MQYPFYRIVYFVQFVTILMFSTQNCTAKALFLNFILAISLKKNNAHNHWFQIAQLESVVQKFTGAS